MFKRLRDFCKRLIARLEDHPATPFVAPADANSGGQQHAKPESPPLFQNVMPLIDRSKRPGPETIVSPAAAPSVSEKYPFRDDCLYVMIFETVKTVSAFGLPFLRWTTCESQIVAPNFDCPQGTTDPLHWTHGPADAQCARTNEASVWCCSHEHMLHIRANCRRGRPSPAQCRHGCVFAKIVNKQNAFLQDREAPAGRSAVHTPVPWDSAGSLSVPVDATTAPAYPAQDRALMFPCPEPVTSANGHSRYVSLPVTGSHLRYELDDNPTTAYPACVAELRPPPRATSPGNGSPSHTDSYQAPSVGDQGVSAAHPCVNTGFGQPQLKGTAGSIAA